MGRHSRPSKIRKNARRFAVGGALAAASVVVPGMGGQASAAPPGGWGPIIDCESGGNPGAQNRSSSASGLFQFLDNSWTAYGGREFAPRAKFAAAGEQMIVAERAYARSGLSPWAASRSCWAGRVTPAAGARHASGLEARPSPVARLQPRHAAPAGPPGTYTVRPGDTLSRIAFTHGRQDWREVQARNRAVVHDAGRIFPGEVLHL